MWSYLVLAGCTAPGVEGTVVDLAGKPVAGALVTQAENPIETHTGADGRFRFPWLGAPATVTVSAPGALPLSARVQRRGWLGEGPAFTLWPDVDVRGGVYAIDRAGAALLELPACTYARPPSTPAPTPGASPSASAGTAPTAPGAAAPAAATPPATPAPVAAVPGTTPTLARRDGLVAFIDDLPKTIRLFPLDESGAFRALEPLPDARLTGVFPYGLVRASRLEPGLYAWAEVSRGAEPRLRDKGACVAFRVGAEDAPSPLNSVLQPTPGPLAELPPGAAAADLALLDQLGMGSAAELVGTRRVVQNRRDEAVVGAALGRLAAGGHRDELDALAVFYPELATRIPPPPAAVSPPPTPGGAP